MKIFVSRKQRWFDKQTHVGWSCRTVVSWQQSFIRIFITCLFTLNDTIVDLMCYMVGKGGVYMSRLALNRASRTMHKPVYRNTYFCTLIRVSKLSKIQAGKRRYTYNINLYSNYSKYEVHPGPDYGQIYHFLTSRFRSDVRECWPFSCPSRRYWRHRVINWWRPASLGVECELKRHSNDVWFRVEYRLDVTEGT